MTFNWGNEQMKINGRWWVRRAEANWAIAEAEATIRELWEDLRKADNVASRCEEASRYYGRG